MVRLRAARTIFGSVVLGAALFFSLATSAPTEGERVDGGCPPGEICSPDTPDGLFFAGTPLGEEILPIPQKPLPTAVGGTQTVSVFLDKAGEHEFLGFTASAGGPSFVVETVATNDIGIKGLAEGSDYLRVFNRETAELFDRLLVDTARVAKVAVLPYQGDLFGDRDLLQAVRPEVVYSADRDVAFYGIALYDGNDRRVVDTSATLQLGLGFKRNAQLWDRFEQTGALPPGKYNLGVTLGDGSTHELSVTLVSGVDSIRWSPGSSDSLLVSPDKGLAVNASQMYCFAGQSGGLTVVGAPFQFSATGPVDLGTPSFDCIVVRATALGTVKLTVASGGLSATFDIPVRANKLQQPAPLPESRPFEGLRGGERAVSAGDDAR